jgi:AraC-like DNA-binding protein
MVALSYRESLPPPDLARWLACCWEIRGTVGQGSGFAHRVLPDGCADLIFDLRDAAGSAPHGRIVGPMSRSAVIDLRAGVDLLGVRLRPGALGAFLGIAADELLDIAIPVCEAPTALRLDPVELAELPDFAMRVARLVAACRARLAALNGFDPVVARALASWGRLPADGTGSPPVSVLVRDVGLSERAFERRFVANVGLTPVRFRRLARLRAVLRLYAGGARDWAAMAAVAGFSDQSHLVRDFQAFVGLPPTRWAQGQARNAGFLQDGQITAL